jgi:hypothetical protein
MATERLPFPTEPTLDSLFSAYVSAERVWRDVEADPDCWQDPTKRARALAMRLDYQDKKLAFVFRLKTGR